jgi:hypothetical protein
MALEPAGDSEAHEEGRQCERRRGAAEPTGEKPRREGHEKRREGPRDELRPVAPVRELCPGVRGVLRKNDEETRDRRERDPGAVRDARTRVPFAPRGREEGYDSRGGRDDGEPHREDPWRRVEPEGPRESPPPRQKVARGLARDAAETLREAERPKGNGRIARRVEEISREDGAKGREHEEPDGGRASPALRTSLRGEDQERREGRRGRESLHGEHARIHEECRENEPGRGAPARPVDRRDEPSEEKNRRVEVRERLGCVREKVARGRRDQRGCDERRERRRGGEASRQRVHEESRRGPRGPVPELQDERRGRRGPGDRVRQDLEQACRGAGRLEECAERVRRAALREKEEGRVVMEETVVEAEEPPDEERQEGGEPCGPLHPIASSRAAIRRAARSHVQRAAISAAASAPFAAASSRFS